MDTAFLEVWYSVIRDSLMSRENGEAAALQVALLSPFKIIRSLFVKLPIAEVGRRDSARLQLLREAMELFTILSVVNNRAFTKFFNEYLGVHPADANSTYYCPQWRLCLVGTLASTDPAAMQAPVLWGTLLGFPEAPSSYSPDFRAAYEKLEAIGVEETSKINIHGSFYTGWKCLFHDSLIESGDRIEKPADTVGLLLAGFENLLRIRVPPIFQFHATGNDTKLFEVWQFPATPCESVFASMTAFTPELTAALTWTRIQSFDLSLYSRDVDLMDDPQTVVNVGFMLNTLLCGRSLDVVLRDSRICLPPTRQVEYNDLTVSSDVPSRVFIAICSAVADMILEPHLYCFDMSSVCEEKWFWFAYALCCGTSSTLVPTVEIARSTLTKRDLVAIEAVLRTKYPRPISQQRSVLPHQYGYVDLSAGTKLQLSSSSNGDSLICLVSRACRCRALYNPASNINSVEMVVPGYGACKAALGGSIRFTHDSENSMIATKWVSGSLKLHFVKVEDTALLMDLLVLLTRGLRSLSLREDKEDRKNLDVTALSVACPDLRTLSTRHFNVVVSAHDEALRRWSIQDMDISATRSISDLTSCLTDRSLRMSKELVKLEVSSSKDEAFSQDEIIELQAHDGEFLPVIKEKFPLSSKLAMISVVTSTFSSKGIRHLDAHILSFIFVLAATPAKREVLYTHRNYY